MELKTRQRPSDWLRRAIIYFFLSLLTLFVVGVGWLGVDGCGWVWMGVDGRMSMSRLSLLSLPSLFPLLSSLFSPFFVSPHLSPHSIPFFLLFPSSFLASCILAFSHPLILPSPLWQFHLAILSPYFSVHPHSILHHDSPSLLPSSPLPIP